MSGFRGSFWQPFKTAPEPPPPPVLQTLAQKVATSATHMRLNNLPTQFCRAIHDEMRERGITNSMMADRLRIRLEGLERLFRGSPMKIPTLERVLIKLGWNLTVHDAKGRVIVRYPPSPDSSAGSPATGPG